MVSRYPHLFQSCNKAPCVSVHYCNLKVAAIYYVTCPTLVARDSQLYYHCSYMNVVCCIAVPLGGKVHKEK